MLFFAIFLIHRKNVAIYKKPQKVYSNVGEKMKKQYIKMNVDDKELSLGNLCRVIKELSVNKLSAMQSEIFCLLFLVDHVNDTTVNNYCVGCRGIGNDFKQTFLNRNKRYLKDKEEFCDTILSLLSIIDGTLYVHIENKISFINENKSASTLSKKLYNIAKNDREVSSLFVSKINGYLVNGDYYKCLVELFLFIVLEKRQPVFEEGLKKEVFENVLNDTSISSIDLQEYLSLKLREGINYENALKQLASKGNSYANFELGCDEYYGYYSGYPRYDKAYEYLIESANMNHAPANYMIGNMYVQGLIGSKRKEELKLGFSYLEKSRKLGNVAACNMLGNMYKEGIYPVKKDIEKALTLYEEASEKDFSFAKNNLGSIYEEKKDFKKAYAYFLESAEAGESWACNKVGEYLRLGILEKDAKKAFTYYKKALESNHRTLCYYAYYNLAKYYYFSGCLDIVLIPDKEKAIEYYEIASKHGIIEATKELFYYYVTLYLEDKKEEIYLKIETYKELLEKEIEEEEELLAISKKVEELKKKKITINCLLEE